jgi:surfeit locus 1 family protein
MPNATLSSDNAPLRRFRPRAVPTLAAIAAVLVFVTAGQWQQRRMHEKEALRAEFDAAAGLAPLDLAAKPGRTDWHALRYRRVTASGEYDARRQILVDNRVHDGRAGYHVITRLVLTDGRAVLVNRGWTPQGASRSALPQVSPPAGTVTVHGRIAIPPAAVFELGKDSASGSTRDSVWQNIDVARFSAATGMAVLPFVVEAVNTPSAPALEDGLVRDWPAPDFGVEKHEIYMVQWYALAVLAIVLWGTLNLRRSRPSPDE